MIDQESMNRLITSGLKSVTGCEVVKPISPTHPFHRIRISHLRSSGLKPEKAPIPMQMVRDISLCTRPGALQYREIRTMMRSTFALLAKDWLEEAGRIDLNDGGVVVQSVGIYLTETRCLQSDMSSGRDLMWCSR